MSTSATFQRTPLVISAGQLSCGTAEASFRDGDIDSLLNSYLVFVRELRGQRRERTITLRENDLSTLAGYVGTSREAVLAGLLDLMGATRAQRTALVALLATGALTVVATGMIVLNLTDDGVTADIPAAPGAAATQAQAVAAVGDARTVAPRLAAPPRETPLAEAAVAPTVAAIQVDVGGLTPGVLSVFDDGLAPASEPLVQVEGEAPSLTETPEPAAWPAPQTAPAPEPSVGIGVDDSGATVAVAQPPVPPAPEPAPAPEAAPAPAPAPASAPAPEPSVGIGVDDSGATVAVAQPPVPPAPEPSVGIGVDDSGATVAVAQPPVPPPTTP